MDFVAIVQSYQNVISKNKRHFNQKMNQKVNHFLNLKKELFHQIRKRSTTFFSNFDVFMFSMSFIEFSLTMKKKI